MTGRPKVYTFFKKTSLDPLNVDQDALTSLWGFRDKLKALGHFPTAHNGIEHLKSQFSDPLRKLRDDGSLNVFSG
ncbi:MAG: hypothetical protein ACI915_005047 [Gammaproteobacteria bacterium]|jgi:hypothetical protein